MELSSLFLAGKGSALTSFFSTAFLVVFLPFCLVVYSLMRKTVRKRQQAVQHRILLLAVILHIGVLFALKYSGFAATNVNTLLAHLHIPVQLAIPKYVMPIGISFFTLQALSYICLLYTSPSPRD